MDTGLLGTAIALLILALVTFGLRVYVRVYILKIWGLDDWLITCAMVSAEDNVMDEI